MIEYGNLGKTAARKLALLPTKQKNEILIAMAKALLNNQELLLEANRQDLDASESYNLSSALIERLTLNPSKIKAMADGIMDAAHLPDPIGEVIETFKSPDGLDISKVRVPLGLLMMIYESRPNVTADAAALAIKSGNAMILKGGKESLHTNKCIASILIESGLSHGLPKHSIQFIDNSDRSITNALLMDTAHIDAVIPRGGVKLKKAILDQAKVPVIMTGSGLCHLYIGASANSKEAISIVLNAKTQRPGVCNAVETLLIDKNYAQTFEILSSLINAGVTLRLDQPLFDAYSNKLKHLSENPVALATEEDWETEYLDLILSVKSVNDVEEACNHIQTYSSGHSEAILTQDSTEAEKFLNTVDSACVYWNASTRFTDGGCFGFGCEIGISTQKLHARGPMGLKELTSYKYRIVGTGNVRG